MSAIRISVTIDNKLLEKLDQVCKEKNMCRSTYIAEAVSKLMEADEAMKEYTPALEQLKALAAEFDRIQKDVAERHAGDTPY